MRTAIISLNREQADHPVPIGLLPLFDRNLLDRQIALARLAGAERVAILTQYEDGALRRDAWLMPKQGLEAELIDRLADIKPPAKGDDLLLIADGVIANRDFAERLQNTEAPQIFAMEARTARPAIEPIDLHRQWAGIALVPASVLTDLEDIPEGWDEFSALFRSCLRGEPPIETLGGEAVSHYGLTRVESARDAENYAQHAIGETVRNAATLPLSWRSDRVYQALLPKLWENARRNQMLSVAAWGISLLAGAAALAAWPVAALLLLTLASLAMGIRQGGDAVLAMAMEERRDMALLPIFWIAILLLLALRASADGQWVAQLIAMAATISAGRALASSESAKIHVPDIALTLLVAFVLTLLFGFAAALYIAAAVALFLWNLDLVLKDRAG